MSKNLIPAPVATSRGLLTVAIGGRERTLKFGMNTLAAYGALHTDSPGDFGTQFTQNPIQALIDMTYCALRVRAADNELPEDFSPATVGDWIDELPQGVWEQIRTTMMGAMVPGNPTKTA